MEEGASPFLDIRLCHDSYVPKQVVLLLLKLITKDQGKLEKTEEFTQQVLKLARWGPTACRVVRGAPRPWGFTPGLFSVVTLARGDLSPTELRAEQKGNLKTGGGLDIFTTLRKEVRAGETHPGLSTCHYIGPPPQTTEHSQVWPPNLTEEQKGNETCSLCRYELWELS